jgi:hypothetical protein
MKFNFYPKNGEKLHGVFVKTIPEWEFLLDHVVPQNWQQTQPEIWASNYHTK